MRINSAQSIALAKRLYRKYGSWRAVRAASAMSAGTAETQSGSGLQPASAAREAGDAQNIAQDIGGPSQ